MNSSEEMDELRQTFEALDIDHNGLLDRKELVAAYEKIMSTEDSKIIVKSILDNIDSNQNGEIDYNEFILASLNRKQLYTDNTLLKAFNKLD